MASSTSPEPRLATSATPFVAVLAGALGLSLAFYGIGPHVAPPPPIGGVAAYAAVVLSVLAVGLMVPWMPLKRAWILVLPAGALVVIAVTRVGAEHPAAAGLVLLCLLSAGGLAGGLVGSRIEVAGHLLVVALVSSLADLFSVFTPGAPSDVIVHSEVLLSVVAIPYCPLGSRTFLPVLGVGDVVMSALYLTTARALHLGRVRMLVALSLGYLACLAALFLSDGVLPALPFLGAAVILFVPEARRLPREEWARAAVGVLLLAMVFGALALR